ncbi:branched-chain amino acid ABC transporter permease [Vagococcus sp. BWB3-3]|uniref:Branched-chain amino acid ABC transporter permease n=1 Tax=Vagococcus allomyrinae TaxID=2794353 RepID=A0A940PHS1_9ENTE|nr:branched-chain amino acid ABC transporter permease [Vagococcus allomyrinae]MBP1044163.1 branched-chain amino acid ABC transporter permease [Vagococcus allomyrinae]
MDIFFQQLINGLSLGSIYALIALGYTMVYGIIKLINFAHGEIYMLGAFIGYYLISKIGLPFLPALLLSMISCSIIGVLIEFLAYRPLRGSTRIAALITAIGVSFLIQNLMVYFVGPEVRAFPQAIKPKNYDLGLFEISNIQVIILVTTIVLMVLLQFIVKGTKMGKAMRAVSVDPDAAKLMGINVDRTISFTFAIGSALAAAAGVLIGLYYNSIDPLMGVTPGLKAFVAAVFGGIGIIPGAALGGFAIGVIETFISGSPIEGMAQYKDAIVYGILIVILLIKPAGLLGKNVKEKV